MNFAFLVGYIFKNNGYIDVFYGLAFVLIASFSLIYSVQDSGEYHITQVVITVLTIIWGLRLATHIFIRNFGKEEDFRYRNFRKNWQENWLWQSYFKIYMLQMVVIAIVSSPILLVNATPANSFTTAIAIVFQIIGFTFWLVGFFFEAVGDWQLQKFKAKQDSKGKIMKSGVWRYTRHPNYFGEVTLWWGIYLISIASPNTWIAFVSPVLITWLLLRVSGIPMLEKKYEGNLEYQQYKKETNAFFPWFPKTNKGENLS
jgi:steroid 5-alpha reductase family enzyme